MRRHQSKKNKKTLWCLITRVSAFSLPLKNMTAFQKHMSAVVTLTRITVNYHIAQRCNNSISTQRSHDAGCRRSATMGAQLPTEMFSSALQGAHEHKVHPAITAPSHIRILARGVRVVIMVCLAKPSHHVSLLTATARLLWAHTHSHKCCDCCHTGMMNREKGLAGYASNPDIQEYIQRNKTVLKSGSRPIFKPYTASFLEKKILSSLDDNIIVV